MNKDVKKFVRQLKANGLRAEQGRNSHIKIYCGPRLVCTISASPSDHRWLRNCEQTLAKNGFGKFTR